MDRNAERRRGSVWLATPLALLAIALLTVGLVFAFLGTDQSDVSWAEGSSAEGSLDPTIHIQGWAVGDALEIDGLSAATTTTVKVEEPDTIRVEQPETILLPATSSTTTTTRFTHPIDDPARIRIPSLGVDAKLIAVGIESNGNMEVPPFGTAAWYELGPAPGAEGPSVIVAHVDSKKGPDVFFSLKDITLGERVMVHGSDGEVATFVVDGKEQQLKTDLPTERIWNDTRSPELRLITCGGQFDRSTGHYRSNVIVYAHLIE